MNNDDFYNYYQYPMRCLECGDSPLFMFPDKAQTKGTEERRKAMDALYRFYKAGLLLNSDAVLKELKDLETLPEIYWAGPVFDLTDEACVFIKSFEPSILEGYANDKSVNADFKAKLSKIFSDAGVGFDQDISY